MILGRQLKPLLRRAETALKAPALRRQTGLKLNLCCGDVILAGYRNIDVCDKADLYLDLERDPLPFAEGSCERVVCISAINYFSRARGLEIIREVHRVLAPGGVARFATQDLRLIATKYVQKERDFFKDAYEGDTMGDKFNAWFYGYVVYGSKHCKYVYDYETLELLFKQAGFRQVEQRAYRDSRLEDVSQIDNRPEQMFFLEAVKDRS